MKRAISWLALILAFAASAAAQAQTRITVLVPEPLKKQMEQLTSQFNAKTGNRVQMSFGTGVSTRQSAGWGGALDVTILFSPYDAALKTANVDKSTQTSIGQLRLAVAVKKGAPKPDISTLAATRQTFLNAKSIASVDPPQGSVGGAALLALDKMGITDQVKPKIKWLPGGGDVEESVAKGETEMTLGPYLSDMGNPADEVVGVLPVEAATPIEITGWVSSNAENPKVARELLNYLASKEAAAVWKAARIFPAH